MASSPTGWLNSFSMMDGVRWIVMNLRDKAKALLALHHVDKMLILPNITNPIGARILADRGFGAVATPSAGIAEQLGVETIYSMFDGIEYMKSYEAITIFLGAFVLVVKLSLDAFLATGIGMSMRAAGANAAMAEANGVDVGKMKLIGVGVANALAAVAGALFAQTIGASDAQSGVGMIIVGLAAVIIGMSLMPSRLIWQATFAVIFGTIAYRLAIAGALNADATGLNASDLQMVTAVLVILVLVAQHYSQKFFASKKGGKK